MLGVASPKPYELECLEPLGRCDTDAYDPDARLYPLGLIPGLGSSYLCLAIAATLILCVRSVPPPTTCPPASPSTTRHGASPHRSHLITSQDLYLSSVGVVLLHKKMRPPPPGCGDEQGTDRPYYSRVPSEMVVHGYPYMAAKSAAKLLIKEREHLVYAVTFVGLAYAWLQIPFIVTDFSTYPSAGDLKAFGMRFLAPSAASGLTCRTTVSASTAAAIEARLAENFAPSKLGGPATSEVRALNICLSLLHYPLPLTSYLLPLTPYPLPLTSSHLSVQPSHRTRPLSHRESSIAHRRR